MISKLQINEFSNATNRIFLLFVALVQWFKFVLGIREQSPPPLLTPPPPTPSQKDVYIEKQKQRFLNTFREEEGGTNINYNSNIDAILKDPTALAELMQIQNNEIERKWRSNVLIETTPRGNIIMFYDAYKRGFSYYCDNSVMPYDIMNAVAMKYVLTFYCRDFFIDSGVLPCPPASSSQSNVNEPKPDTNTTKTKTNIPIKNAAFVKFKSYNTATKKADVSTEKDKTINCFLHLGASRNWTPISKKARPNPINGFQTNMVPNNTVKTQTKGSSNMDSDSRQVLSSSEKKTLTESKEIETTKDIRVVREDSNVKVHVTKEKNKMSYLDYKNMHKSD